MREQLIGYLLDALDPAEREVVDAELSRDPQLQQEMSLLSRSLLPLAADRGFYDPPPGLAHRTCEFVAAQTRTLVAPHPPLNARSRWRMPDFVVAAGIFLAATMLFFPALNQSRFAMRVSGCQNNLRQIGMALRDYSQAHHGYFPDVPLNGCAAAAGIFATRLHEHGLIPAATLFVCPASQLAEQNTEFHIASLKDLQQADGEHLKTMHKSLGGSYGYNLGYVTGGSYCSTKDLSRPRFALVADAPAATPPYHSPNHGGCSQNVLFEDGHVQFLTTCKAHGCSDDIFVNDDGQPAPAPGLHVNDAVVAPSHARPLLPAKPAALPGLGK